MSYVSPDGVWLHVTWQDEDDRVRRSVFADRSSAAQYYSAVLAGQGERQSELLRQFEVGQSATGERVDWP